MTIYNFTLLNVPFASGAPSSEIAPFSDFVRGLGIAFDETEGKPEMKGLNGLFNMITTSALYLKQRGICEWDPELEYPINGFVTEGSKVYRAIRQNTNKQPSLSQLDWAVWASISDISVSTNGNLKKTTNTDGSVLLEVPTASDSQRGVMRFATPTEVANKANVNAAITPKNVVDMFTQTLATSGSCTLPNDLVIKWGVTNHGDISHTTDFNIPFPSAFPNAVFSVVANEGGLQPCFINVINKSNTGFTARVTEANQNVASGNINWFAIGY
ncbi:MULTISPECIES: gp53-like domain-containing protein [Enterobacteriaceae]|uniref:gp53-like domain-containing protein n=1 Tax=Enterobacteriaceae TaxID=543 RepID=UPI002E2DDAC7|nr:hypothetical protein [Klebsiella pneumoniae]MED6004882.1 hypothetical protein [Klebsiella pneumoniae]MED6058304.1 hypothetical protein [Klebsiella pneumoniae]